MKERGLIFWLILMIVLYGFVFYLSPNITGMFVPPTGDCDSNDDCSLLYSTPYCDLEEGSLTYQKCVGCVLSEHCFGSNPICDDRICRRCVDDDECSYKDSSKPYCLDIGECAECKIENTQTIGCSDDKPVCSDNVCVECTDDDLSKCETGEICSDNVCICIENWDCDEWGECANDVQTRTCTDLNSCGTTETKPDESQSCVVVFKGKIIELNRMDSSTKSVKFYVDNSDVLSSGYDSSKTVLINNSVNKQKLVEFNYDFSKYDLNLSGVLVKYQTGSNRGYTLVKGLDLKDRKKIFYVKNTKKIGYVCIKDSEVSSVSEISSGCNDNNEKILECDGDVSDGYSCSDLGDYYKIKGLSHSVVKEISCNESWSCGDWTDCSKSGYQTRVCTDKSNCRTKLFKPEIRQSCFYDDFTDYGAGADEDLIDTEDGEDLIDTGVGVGDGDLESVIVEKPSGGFLDTKIILLIVVVVIWLGFMIWFFLLRGKGKEKTTKDEMFKKEGEAPKIEKKLKKEIPKKIPEKTRHPVGDWPSAKLKKKQSSKDVSDEMPW